MCAGRQALCPSGPQDENQEQRTLGQEASVYPLLVQLPDTGR